MVALLFVEARRPIRNFKSMLDDIREQQDRRAVALANNSVTKSREAFHGVGRLATIP